jgi:putative membrane protein insertion efficiency factor
MRQFAKLVTLQLLRAYQWAISPMFAPACRYVPTCSQYAMEAVERYGALRGGLMAWWRLLRCHPLARGGYDPVVTVRAGCGRGTNLPPGLEPSAMADDSLQRSQRSATPNPNPSNLNGTALTRNAI